jgi:hypothetical protein
MNDGNSYGNCLCSRINDNGGRKIGRDIEYPATVNLIDSHREWSSSYRDMAVFSSTVSAPRIPLRSVAFSMDRTDLNLLEVCELFMDK